MASYQAAGYPVETSSRVDLVSIYTASLH